MYRNGKWARRLMELQREDGSWGQFHSMATYGDSPVTTEQALRRLRILGYTIKDECIRRAVDYMDDCLNGRRAIPDPREKAHDWDVFTELMLSTRIREFTLENPSANRVAEKWAKVVSHAFADGKFSRVSYEEAYLEVLKPWGGRLVDFTCFYPMSLLQGMLDARTENAVMQYVLAKPDGMYYVYDRPLNEPPQFAGLSASRYLGGIEILAGYRHARSQLTFAADWLDEHRGKDGWDMGQGAKDGVYFPLSDDWRRSERRIADCTHRIERLLARLRS